jgi:hypothetical protein
MDLLENFEKKNPYLISPKIIIIIIIIIIK